MEDNYKNNMVFGIHPVLELIRSQKEIEKVYIQGGTRSPEIAEIANTCRANGVPVQFVPIEKMNRLTRKNHQGVVAFICPIEYQPLEKVVQMVFEDGRDPFVLMLDRVTDVRNFGAIARTCVCAGVHALIIGTRGSAAINGDAVKASAGALHSLPICKVENLQNALQYLQESGLRIVAATEHTDRNYTEVDMTVPTCIVMGSEEKGIYEENLKLCTDQVRLPMTGVIESLNVSVAAGVFIYEAVRQRSCK
jgi:23S rRNA (guanosine2251-2'-O)-methyltransferase